MQLTLQQKLDKFHARPFSWSQFSSFRYDKKKWYDSYILDIKQSSVELTFGSWAGKRLETDPDFIPQVPRHNKMEMPFKVVFGDMTIVGYADSFCTITNRKLLEYKTGVKKWDKKRVDEHGQLTMYALMNYITNKIAPEDMEIQLVWLPTKKKVTGDFHEAIDFIEPIEKNLKIFKTKRTMTDIVKFGAEIKEVYREMEEYLQNTL